MLVDDISAISSKEIIKKMSNLDKIGLVGFDLHKPGNDIYYFTKEEGSKDVEWCYNDQIYSFHLMGKSPGLLLR